MTVEKAIAALRVRQLALAEENEALTVLLEESMRMKKALKFYANRENYIDGTPMLKNDETGLLDTEDGGAMARQALRLMDVSLGVVVPRGGENVAA